MGKLVFPFTSRGLRLSRRALAVVFRRLYLLLEENPVAIVPLSQANLLAGAVGQDLYALWRRLHTPRPSDLQEQRERSRLFSYRPTISILLPVCDPSLDFFEQTLQSVLAQSYTQWELCIADDASTNPGVRDLIEEYVKRDPRIKVVYRRQNGHISASTNSALALASGEFCAFLDHDDLLAPEALYQNVQALNLNPGIEVLYSDEDKIDERNKHFSPSFKPQWCPDSLLARNYIAHFLVARTSLVREVGGAREGFEGSQDHDLILRLTERAQQVYHIPRVLYHWRSHAESTAESILAKPYALDAGIRAVQEAIARRGEPGEVRHWDGAPGYYDIRYHVASAGKVSVIIPTRDQASVLQSCLSSLFDLTDYPDFEVVLIDNNSTQADTFALLQGYQAKYGERFRVLHVPIPFNFSLLMNAGAAEARGEYLLLLNNDTEIKQSDWMRRMVEQAQRPSIGCVGPQLLFPNGMIQHGGVAIGRTGTAVHLFCGADPREAGYFYWSQVLNNLSAVTGACLMVRREVYHQVGGFDPELVVDFNDIDFCLRVRESGLNNVYVGNVQVCHHESLSRGHPQRDEASMARLMRDAAIFEKRWWKYMENDPCLSPHLTTTGPELVIQLTPATKGKNGVKMVRRAAA